MIQSTPEGTTVTTHKILKASSTKCHLYIKAKKKEK